MSIQVKKTQSFFQGTKADAIKEFYKKALLMQEEEKKRISRDLHDETGQIVIALGALLNIIEREIKEGCPEKALTLINENRTLIQEISAKMKSMARNLRPPAFDILGLPAILREYFSQCTKSHPLKIEFHENLKETKLDEDIEINLYRIIQEAVYNIIQHSAANLVRVVLLFNSQKLHLLIEDNGHGFNVEQYYKNFGIKKMGLRGIEERVDILNGSFTINSILNKGTKITIALPAADKTKLSALRPINKQTEEITNGNY